MALNTLSTSLMIFLGKVHQGLMVDVQAANEKLQKRSEAMLYAIDGNESVMTHAMHCRKRTET